jgi:hypothetical protein
MPLQNMSLVIDNIFLSYNLMEHYISSILQKKKRKKVSFKIKKTYQRSYL